MSNSLDLAVARTTIFTSFLAKHIESFRRTQGFNRWLKEYEDMDKHGYFSPAKLQRLYIRMLMGGHPLNFICRCAINYIGCNALLGATIYVRSRTYAIHYITGGVAEDNMEIPLTGLDIIEAEKTCREMNKEAEEELFIICDLSNNRKIKVV